MPKNQIQLVLIVKICEYMVQYTVQDMFQPCCNIYHEGNIWQDENYTELVYWITSPIFFTFKVTLVYGRISEEICYL
jgi:hypothetical protein